MLLWSSSLSISSPGSGSEPEMLLVAAEYSSARGTIEGETEEEENAIHTPREGRGVEEGIA